MAKPRYTYWHKDRHLPHEMDPVTGDWLPTAIQPGIYCATAEGQVALMRGLAERGKSVGADVRADGVGYAVDGMAVYVATSAQAAILQALSTEEPLPPEPHDSVEAWCAEALARLDALIREQNPPPAVAHPFRGTNRHARRAAAARQGRI